MKADKSFDPVKLLKLLDEATSGPWRIDSGMMGDSLWITAHEREGFARSRKNSDGPICHVSTERTHYDHDKDRYGNVQGISKNWKTPIQKARKDAELIVEAVNALPELLRRLKLDADETAWLIEWPSDKYGPVRYWAAGEPQPVIDSALATRFARREDAETVMRANAAKGAAVAEHMWMKPTKAEAA